jgi:TolB-like protein
VTVSVGGRAFDALAVLAAAAGATVGKEALLDAVWPGLTVEENNLQVQISALRKALGEGWIVTVPGRGYRLAPQPTSAEPATAPTLALPDKPSLVVLPFHDMSSDGEQEYFVDGLAEDITTALSCMRWLFVIARNSAFTYKGRAVDVRQVGRELGVRYVLEGSVRKAGNRVRISGQLVDAINGAHVWADRFDGALEDIFDLQDRVTSSVVSAIEPKILGAEIERVKRKPTESLQAYDLVLRAIPHMAARSRDGHREATRLLERAIKIDPNYALALAFLAWCHNLPWVQGWLERRTPHDEIMRLTQTALQYGADDPAVLSNAGFLISQVAGDLDGGLALMERSLALNSNWHLHQPRPARCTATRATSTGRSLMPNVPHGLIRWKSLALAPISRSRWLISSPDDMRPRSNIPAKICATTLTIQARCDFTPHVSVSWDASTMADVPCSGCLP